MKVDGINLHLTCPLLESSFRSIVNFIFSVKNPDLDNYSKNGY